MSDELTKLAAAHNEAMANLRKYNAIDKAALERAVNDSKKALVDYAGSAETSFDMPDSKPAVPSAFNNTIAGSGAPTDSIEKPTKIETEAVLNNDTPFTGMHGGRVYPDKPNTGSS